MSEILDPTGRLKAGMFVRWKSSENLYAQMEIVSLLNPFGLYTRPLCPEDSDFVRKMALALEGDLHRTVPCDGEHPKATLRPELLRVQYRWLVLKTETTCYAHHLEEAPLKEMEQCRYCHAEYLWARAVDHFWDDIGDRCPERPAGCECKSQEGCECPGGPWPRRRR